jgi:hypothetical protein
MAVEIQTQPLRVPANAPYSSRSGTAIAAREGAPFEVLIRPLMWDRRDVEVTTVHYRPQAVTAARAPNGP